MKKTDKELAEIGNRIAQKRLALRFSQKELADLVGVSQSAIAQSEKGATNLSYEMLAKIAGPLKTTVADLVSDSELPTKVAIDPAASLKDNLEKIKNYLESEINKIPKTDKPKGPLPGLKLIPSDVYDLLSDVAQMPNGIDMLRAFLQGITANKKR